MWVNKYQVCFCSCPLPLPGCWCQAQPSVIGGHRHGVHPDVCVPSMKDQPCADHSLGNLSLQSFVASWTLQAHVFLFHTKLEARGGEKMTHLPLGLINSDRNPGCWYSWDWTSALTLNRKGSSSLLKNLQCIKKIMWKLQRSRHKFNNTWLFYVSGGKSEILCNYSEYICMYTSLFMGTYPGKHILRNGAPIKALYSAQT